MKEKLAALLALQQLDTAIDSLKRQFAKLDSGKTEQSAHQAAQLARKEADGAVSAAKAAAADTELEQKSIEEKRVAYETKLYSGKVTSPKELQAIQDEVDMLARNRDRLDEKLKSLMEELEECRVRQSQAVKAMKEADAHSKSVQAAYKLETETIVAQARETIAKREEASKQMPPEILKLYNTIRRDKSGIAVVPVEDGNSCGGCKMGISSSTVKRLQAGNSIETCDNCLRILVMTK